jgi:sugar/nucleoside kinase (ribokinase family)
LVVVVVVVELAVPAGVSTVVDFVVSVDVLGAGDTFTVVLEVVLSAGFSFTTVVEDVDPDGVTSALQPARVTATSAARA